MKPFKKRREVGPWSNQNRVGAKLFLVVIVASVLSGPITAAMLLVGGAGRPTTSTAAPSTAATSDGAADAAGGVAADFVAAWLSASADDEATIQARLAIPVDLELPTDRPQPPDSVVPTSVTETGDGRYDVDVIARHGAKATAWRVDVRVAGTGAVVQTLPGSIPVPGVQQVEQQQLEELPRAHPASETLLGFMDAFLAGNGAVDRWTAPQSTFTAVTPAQCKQVDAMGRTTAELPESPATGTEARVAVTVRCQEGAATTTTRTLTYGVLLIGRDGRWEVGQFVPASTVTVAPSETATAAPQSSPAGPEESPTPERTPS